MRAREQAMAKTRITLDQASTRSCEEGETKELNIIIKADVGGTAEVLTRHAAKALHRKGHDPRASTRVSAPSRKRTSCWPRRPNAIIIGFNVRPERKAAESAEHEKVDIRLHTIIYELTDEIKKAMVGMLEPVFKEVYQGRADVRETFRITKVGTVAGCYVRTAS
ncbi:MAG: hypothetical protein QM757_24680 [Paludibaculum sp.]